MAKSITITGLQDFLKDIENAQKELKEEVDFVLQDSANNVVLNAKRDAPKNFGMLANGISSYKVQGTELTYEIVSSADYSAFMEFGTGTRVQIPAGLEQFAAQFRGQQGTGKVSAKEAVYDWCRRQGIEEGRWYAIYISLMVKGTNPHPFFFHNYFHEQKKLVDELKKIVEGK